MKQVLQKGLSWVSVWEPAIASGAICHRISQLPEASRQVIRKSSNIRMTSSRSTKTWLRLGPFRNLCSTIEG